MMNSIFVYGGCVSRDIFNPEYNEGELNLVNYVARSSIAKVPDKSIIISVDPKKVTSAFQRKLLINDAKNNLLEIINKSEFDFLLMDFMYLRYRIISYKDTWLTYSNEFKKSGIIKSSSQMLSFEDELFWRKFEQGVELLLSHLDQKNSLKKIIVNNLYLAKHNEQGELLDNQEYIERFNDVLSRAYEYIGQFISVEQHISYDEKFFISNSTHKWGADPMHYTDSFYQESYLKIANKNK